MSTPSKPVVTRIAPSPTGAMHVGNARAALFNWLYARHTGGKFLLRIEDTDRERSTPESVKVIFDSLEWLGLQYDGEPVFQFARADIHRAAAEQMLASGKAYRCFMTSEETDAAREQARAEGHALRSPWRDQEAGHNQVALPHTIRFRIPDDPEVVVEDLVRGRVAVPSKDLEDFIILRSDGTPIYNLAVTVDDHDMGVTHVIRGEEHLSNAHRQTLLYRAMGWEVPVFAHLPLILGKDGGKLSKRHGAQSVGEFREMGYLPEAIRNYLARLGWGHGDDELFTDEQAIAWFDVADVTKAGARLDWDKLNHVNNHHLRLADDGRLADLVLHVLKTRDVRLPAQAREKLIAAIALVKEGAKTIPELADLSLFALKTRPLTLDEKAQNQLTEETRARLGRLSQALSSAADWAVPPLEQALRSFAESEGVGIGKFGPALRGVLSGGSPAPDLASTLVILGREESLGRISDALSQVR